MLRTIFDPYSDLFLEYIETSKKNDMQTNHYHDTYELFFCGEGAFLGMTFNSITCGGKF